MYAAMFVVMFGYINSTFFQQKIKKNKNNKNNNKK